jgi:hypothetical protein
MTMDNYRTIERKLRNLEQFKGNSLRSEIEFYDGKPQYVIYSYRTIIAMHRDGIGAVIEKKYSTTTSRHQNLIRRAWGL